MYLGLYKNTLQLSDLESIRVHIINVIRSPFLPHISRFLSRFPLLKNGRTNQKGSRQQNADQQR